MSFVCISELTAAPKQSFSLETNKINSNLESTSEFFFPILLTQPVTYRLVIDGRLRGWSKEDKKKKYLITATYPQAEGLHQVAQRERDGDGDGGGVNTA